MEATTRLHPLVGAAAVSVIVLSVAGVGALTGILPKSVGSTGAPQSAGEVPASGVSAPAAAATPAAPGGVTVVVPAVREAAPAQPKTVKKAVVRASVPAEPSKRLEPYPAPLPRDPEDDYVRTERAPVRVAEARPEPVAAAPRCLTCGTVQSVREIEQKGEGTGLGAVAGGIAGAVVGKQFGNGTGRTIMSVLGAAGGAYAGHQVEKHVRGTKHWEVSVLLDDGSTRTIPMETQPAWRSGDRVRYVNGMLEPERV